jgi:hypothetical protein
MRAGKTRQQKPQNFGPGKNHEATHSKESGEKIRFPKILQETETTPAGYFQLSRQIAEIIDIFSISQVRSANTPKQIEI